MRPLPEPNYRVGPSLSDPSSPSLPSGGRAVCQGCGEWLDCVLCGHQAREARSLPSIPVESCEGCGGSGERVGIPAHDGRGAIEVPVTPCSCVSGFVPSKEAERVATIAVMRSPSMTGSQLTRWAAEEFAHAALLAALRIEQDR